MAIDWVTDNSVGTLTNEAQLNLRVACSGNSTFCSGAGLMSAYQSNTATSFLTGTASSLANESLETLSFDAFAVSGTDIVFTGAPTPLQPGGIAGITNILLSSLSSVTSVLSGYTLDQTDGQSIAVSFSGMEWAITADTNVAAIGQLALESGPIISAVGTLVEVGTNAAPAFELRDLRGEFALLTGTVLSGATVAMTFRATFTLNLSGLGTVIPEPGTFVLLAGGILAFGAAAARRRRS